MSSKRISILGFGTVASGVVRILTGQSGMVSRRSGCEFDIRHVAVRDVSKPRDVELPAGVITADWKSAATDPEVEIVLELMGGTTTAREAVLAAIGAGKHVVTANKSLLSEHGDEIFSAAREAGVCVAYEAAVAGGVPIISTLQTSMTSNQIVSISAILNGTSNFILSGMLGERRSYDDVLAEAQRLGYAESDPAMDVDGTDAAQKLVLLTQLVLGKRVSLDEFPRQGIDTLDLDDMLYAQELGYRVKLLAVSKLTGGQLEMHVEPTLVREDRAIAQTDGPLNLVELEGDAVGRLVLSGAGAGQMPTASAVVADLIDVAVGRTQQSFPLLEIWNANDSLKVLPAEQIERRYYLRFSVEDRPHVIADIADILGRNEISVATIVQHEAPEVELSDDSGAVLVPLVIMTHRTTEGRLRASEAEFAKLSTVQSRYVRMPVAD
ncbi:MAG: homoserine dehydrogenase [Planctomycetota bacterium]|mgnify:CR=1 FL=1|nr:homoserine dehydrogenase [Planctomycetota bacterium]MDA1248293.1 homoserine dehydrogenase [Planctomycetota bacterium]